jgi:hypothetical protein
MMIGPDPVKKSVNAPRTDDSPGCVRKYDIQTRAIIDININAKYFVNKVDEWRIF